ncbi:hypothetical protein LFREDSHE_03930 [Shewanella baltica]
MDTAIKTPIEMLAHWAKTQGIKSIYANLSRVNSLILLGPKFKKKCNNWPVPYSI